MVISHGMSSVHTCNWNMLRKKIPIKGQRSSEIYVYVMSMEIVKCFESSHQRHSFVKWSRLLCDIKQRQCVGFQFPTIGLRFKTASGLIFFTKVIKIKDNRVQIENVAKNLVSQTSSIISPRIWNAYAHARNGSSIAASSWTTLEKDFAF